MRGIRLDSSGAGFLVANSPGSHTYLEVAHIDMPMSLGRASLTTDGTVTATGFSVSLEIIRLTSVVGQSSQIAVVPAPGNGIVVASLGSPSPQAFVPVPFLFPSPKTALVLLQPQDVLVLHFAQTTVSGGTWPTGYLRLDLFPRH